MVVVVVIPVVLVAIRVGYGLEIQELELELRVKVVFKLKAAKTEIDTYLLQVVVVAIRYGRATAVALPDTHEATEQADLQGPKYVMAVCNHVTSTNSMRNSS